MIIPVVFLKVLALAMEGTVTLNPQTSPIKSNTPKPEASTAHDARMSTDMRGLWDRATGMPQRAQHPWVKVWG